MRTPSIASVLANPASAYPNGPPVETPRALLGLQIAIGCGTGAHAVRRWPARSALAASRPDGTVPLLCVRCLKPGAGDVSNVDQVPAAAPEEWAQLYEYRTGELLELYAAERYPDAARAEQAAAEGAARRMRAEADRLAVIVQVAQDIADAKERWKAARADVAAAHGRKAAAEDAYRATLAAIDAHQG